MVATSSTVSFSSPWRTRSAPTRSTGTLPGLQWMSEAPASDRARSSSRCSMASPSAGFDQILRPAYAMGPTWWSRPTRTSTASATSAVGPEVETGSGRCSTPDSAASVAAVEVATASRS